MATVGVIGAGTMGAGIAQVAAQAGWTARLMDIDASRAAAGVASIRKSLDRLVEKGKLPTSERDAACGRIHVAATPADMADCDLVIEAVFEDLNVKARTLAPVVALAAKALFASNTSSLSIGRIAEATIVEARSRGAGDAAANLAARFVGMHFFNPVPLMPLVEIIAGAASDAACVSRAAEIAQSWGKTAVRAADAPGFIVNRVARGYYLESLRLLGEGVAGVDEIDRTMRSLGGFRMGPFELMDLIGIDVNFSVSRSVWEQLGRPARLTPHAIQQELFQRGHFGRKTGRGFYAYDREPPVPAVPVDRRSFLLHGKLYEAVRRVAERMARADGSQTEQYVLTRVIVTVMNEAALMLDEANATAAAIDTAMKLGANYPRGPLELCEHIGRHTCAALLRTMDEQAGDGRFTPAEWLAA
ncbi:MAG: 3-hydroxyacyl-CoA dehydrogenase NAD-binding domain-containing protein [Phycisphaerae bacterium]